MRRFVLVWIEIIGCGGILSYISLVLMRRHKVGMTVLVLNDLSGRNLVMAWGCCWIRDALMVVIVMVVVEMMIRLESVGRVAGLVRRRRAFGPSRIRAGVVRVGHNAKVSPECRAFFKVGTGTSELNVKIRS